MRNNFNILVLTLSFILFSLGLLAQPPNNRCANAIELCADNPIQGSNVGASSTFCTNCEDDFNFCFSGRNTVWYYFETNEIGGDVEVTISNMDFQQNPGNVDGLDAMVVSSNNPCEGNTYNLVSNCEANENSEIVLLASNLVPQTTYWIVVNGQSDGVNNAQAEFEIGIRGPGVQVFPFIYISTLENLICEGETFTLVATIFDCADYGLISWFKNGELYATTSGNTFIMDSHLDGDQIVARVNCDDFCGRQLSSNVLTLDVESFVIDAGEDFEILLGDTVRLNGYSEGTEIIYWEPTIHLLNENTLNPFVSPTETTTYFLNASNGDCMRRDEVTVTVIKEFEVPNTFSPNGDGINDTWEIPGIELFPDAFVQVYNRWGQLVFQTSGYNDPSKYWDGRSNRGKELTPGVYFYVINLRDERFPDPLKGHITIVR